MLAVTTRPTKDRDARRFAVYVTERMLADGEMDIHSVPFVERAFYELALRDNFTMEEIPEEERIRETFPCQYYDKDTSKTKTAVCSTSYALKMHLEPDIYSGDCITMAIEQMYDYQWRRLYDERAKRCSGVGTGSDGVSGRAQCKGNDFTSPKRTSLLSADSKATRLPRKRLGGLRKGKKGYKGLTRVLQRQP